MIGYDRDISLALYNLSGSWLSLVLWKLFWWKSLGVMKLPRYGKIKNDPNHQPANWLQEVVLSLNRFFGDTGIQMFVDWVGWDYRWGWMVVIRIRTRMNSHRRYKRKEGCDELQGFLSKCLYLRCGFDNFVTEQFLSTPVALIIFIQIWAWKSVSLIYLF